MRMLLLLLVVPLAACAKHTTSVVEGQTPVRETDAAIRRGLAWLAAHHDVGRGRFDAKGFMKHDRETDRCDGAGNPLYDVGVTGLATLAFLAAGHTDRGTAEENPHAKSVRQALRFLIEVQDPEGCFGHRRTVAFMYNHAIATLAMCEAYGRTRNPRYLKPAQDGIAFILAAQNPGAGWRYEPRGRESDTSVTAWCVSALDAARRSGLAVPPQAFADAVAWVDKMTDPNSGRVGYNYPGGSSARYEAVHVRFPAERTDAMTAAGMWIRFLADAGEGDAIAKGTKLCLKNPPAWGEGTTDVYYWYFGTLAFSRIGGEACRAWNAKLLEAVGPKQLTGGARAGSWDPIDPWGLHEGGRIYMTAMLTLCLEEAGR